MHATCYIFDVPLVGLCDDGTGVRGEVDPPTVHVEWQAVHSRYSGVGQVSVE